jgi:hypothetical protein
VINWRLQDYILSGVFAALIFATAFLLGSGIIMATGIPATGGIANILAAVLVLVVGAHLVPKPGFGVLTMGLMFTLAIPTLIGGPPGAFKIANGILIGLVFDIVVILGQRGFWAYVAAGSLAAVTSITSIYAAMLLLGLPGAEKLQPLLLPLTIMQAITGAIGGWLGSMIYERRLKNLRFVRQLRDNVL